MPRLAGYCYTEGALEPWISVLPKTLLEPGCLQRCTYHKGADVTMIG